jgi:exosortase/archaeosortase family protein
MRMVILDRARRRFGFHVLFGLWALVTAYTLDRWDAALSLPYMAAMSSVSAALLDFVGIPVTLGGVSGSYAILSMDHVVFHVTRECTGVYALGLYVAAVLSYPATLPQRLQALSWGLPAFFVYSVARLVLLALAALWLPEWTQFLHVYLLVIVNAGFLLWLWAVWVNRLTPQASPSSA